MPNNQLYTAVSSARFQRYLNAAGDIKRGMKLYRANILLSQKMYGIIGIFEIILRNSIDRYMITKKGGTWLEDSVKVGGCFYGQSGCEDTVESVTKAIKNLNSKYTHDNLISKLTLGFWTYQFATKEYAAANSNLLDIFINRDFGTRQKDIFKSLFKINDTRNRVAHYEPICFKENTINTDRTLRRYQLILELMGWLGCNNKKLFYGVNGVKSAIHKVDNV